MTADYSSRVKLLEHRVDKLAGRVAVLESASQQLTDTRAKLEQALAVLREATRALGARQ